MEDLAKKFQDGLKNIFGRFFKNTRCKKANRSFYNWGYLPFSWALSGFYSS
jgi:hypothetical protein